MIGSPTTSVIAPYHGGVGGGVQIYLSKLIDTGSKPVGCSLKPLNINQLVFGY